MIDILKHKLELSCPACGFINEITLAQVANEEEIICTGCMKTIKLVDKDKSVKTSAKDIRRSMNNLKKVFK